MSNISEKALTVINLVKQAVSNSITGVSFFSIRNYTNSKGEVSNQLINVGINYAKAKEDDLKTLANMDLTKQGFKSNINDLKEAKAELIVSMVKPSETRSKGQTDAYTIIFDGVKVHNETGQLYIYGFRQSKTVLKEGVYKHVNSSAKTIAKNEITKKLKTGNFSNFAIEVGNTLKANGETIEL